jgi:hypothetical protein
LSFTIINAKCDPQASQDKTLPTNSYLVEYEDEGGVLLHDIVITDKQADVFDHYYDKYKKDFVFISQTEGRINPRLWNPKSNKKEK